MTLIDNEREQWQFAINVAQSQVSDPVIEEPVFDMSLSMFGTTRWFVSQIVGPFVLVPCNRLDQDCQWPFSKWTDLC